MKQSATGRGSEKREGSVNSIVNDVLRPHLILFGLSVAYFIFSVITVARFIRQDAFVLAPYWYFGVAMTRPFILLLASALLLIDRPWSFALSILLAANIIYSNIFRAFIGISYAHGISLFGVDAVRVWWQIMSSTQIIETGLSVILLVFSIAKLSHAITRRIRHESTMQ